MLEYWHLRYLELLYMTLTLEYPVVCTTPISSKPTNGSKVMPSVIGVESEVMSCHLSMILQTNSCQSSLDEFKICQKCFSFP